MCALGGGNTRRTGDIAVAGMPVQLGCVQTSDHGLQCKSCEFIASLQTDRIANGPHSAPPTVHRRAVIGVMLTIGTIPTRVPQEPRSWPRSARDPVPVRHGPSRSSGRLDRLAQRIGSSPQADRLDGLGPAARLRPPAQVGAHARRHGPDAARRQRVGWAECLATAAQQRIDRPRRQACDAVPGVRHGRGSVVFEGRARAHPERPDRRPRTLARYPAAQLVGAPN
jgi:hypothetical protein